MKKTTPIETSLELKTDDERDFINFNLVETDGKELELIIQVRETGIQTKVIMDFEEAKEVLSTLVKMMKFWVEYNYKHHH
jgi:hypothetical protein